MFYLYEVIIQIKPGGAYSGSESRKQYVPFFSGKLRTIKRRFLLSRPTERIVVVVDDDLEVREALMSLLHSAQFNARTFSSAEDALKSGLLRRASCLISDLHMPGMQGLELQRLVKREYPELPVLLITGHREEMVENGSLFKGAAPLFYKPLHPEEFLNAIESAISDSPQTR